MNHWLTSTRIRTRLLITYVGILVVGFAALAVVAGQQISTAALADYERRLMNEIQLVAQGIRPYLTGSATDETHLNETLLEYETRVGCELELLQLDDPDKSNTTRPPTEYEDHPSFRDMPEVETAMRGEIIVVNRKNKYGQDALYTAAPVGDTRRNAGIIQLSIPIANLYAVILERWLALLIIFGGVTGMAIVAVLLLSRSIIQPLTKLRESAVRLSHGDLSHRIDYLHRDEIGEVAQAFNEMAQQVESMLEEQRAFASNASHELRTPLTTIRLRTEALRYEQGLDMQTAKQYVIEIDDEISRLGSLIEDLTLLSRFDAGRAELGDHEIDFARFAASLQQRMQLQAAAKQIELQVIAPAQTLTVRASINHLTIAFRNLLDNAIKYTPVSSADHPTKITWQLSAGVDGVVSVIHDTGNGINPSQLPHLFERFYRADKARSRDIPGTGLGLAIVKSIIEAYHGTITIESEGIGHGTTVTVFLPYAKANQNEV